MLAIQNLRYTVDWKNKCRLWTWVLHCLNWPWHLLQHGLRFPVGSYCCAIRIWILTGEQQKSNYIWWQRNFPFLSITQHEHRLIKGSWNPADQWQCSKGNQPPPSAMSLHHLFIHCFTFMVSVVTVISGHIWIFHVNIHLLTNWNASNMLEICISNIFCFLTVLKV